MRIAFESRAEYWLVKLIVSQPLLAIPYELHPDECAVTVTEPIIGDLLERLARHLPTVLPVPGNEEDTWLVVGKELRKLAQAFQHLTRFVLPTYGLLPDGLRMATYCPFSSGLSPVYDAASACFDGAYTWRSPVHYRVIVMNKVRQWALLESAQPVMRIERPPTYSQLLARFDSTLAAIDWPGAEAVLAELRQLHMVTAENLAFLRVQLLAEQGNWRGIWDDADYALLAGMRVPRQVRRALITAFHACMLMEPEAIGNMALAIERFKQTRGRLGVLLNGRFDLADAPVVRVFGYQAVVAEDRASLETLLLLKPLDAATRACLTALASLLPATVPPQVPPTERLRLALRRGDYDAAAQAANDQETQVDRALAWLQVAVRHTDAGRLALAAYEALSVTEQAELEKADPAVDFYLERALGSFHQDIPEIRSWHAWFERFMTNSDDPILETTLDEIKDKFDDRDWNSDLARSLAGDIGKLIGEHETLLPRTLTVRVLDHLVNKALLDRGFPRPDSDFWELYDSLYTYLIYMIEPTVQSCTKLLRLVDAILQAAPSRLASIVHDLQTWLTTPRLALQEQLIAAFELLVEHGQARNAFSRWYRAWVAHLLDLPTSVPWDRTSQQAWLAFGEWLQPGDDLLLPQRQRLAAVEAQPEQDRLQSLPAGYRIGLFTLQASSAERAKELLLARNPTLDVRLCRATDMSPQVEALARHVDIAVIVSTCITHAITYGIRPLLTRDPIYPASRGSSSIVRVLEEHAIDLSL